jgi:Ca2+-binding RTX toxin-like protein
MLMEQQPRRSTMRDLLRLMTLTTGLVAFVGGSVLADDCTVAGVTYPCDFICGFPSNPPNNPCVAINNDVNGDGFKTTCGSTLGGNTINGSGADDIICGRDGDDTITGGGGNDKINGGGGNDNIDGGNGNDVIEGGLGSDILTGGSGDDTIYGISTSDLSSDDGGNLIKGENGNDFLVGAGGDDEIFGGANDDTIIGEGGRDVMKGEGGNDFIIDNYGGAIVNEVFGSLLCGGTGDDTLFANGPGHQCVDAGTQQVVSGPSDHDCTYINSPADSDDHDVGTQRNCANPSGFDGTRHPSCGCD